MDSSASKRASEGETIKSWEGWTNYKNCDAIRLIIYCIMSDFSLFIKSHFLLTKFFFREKFVKLVKAVNLKILKRIWRSKTNAIFHTTIFVEASYEFFMLPFFVFNSFARNVIALNFDRKMISFRERKFSLSLVPWTCSTGELSDNIIAISL